MEGKKSADEHEEGEGLIQLSNEDGELIQNSQRRIRKLENDLEKSI